MAERVESGTPDGLTQDSATRDGAATRDAGARGSIDAEPNTSPNRIQSTVDEPQLEPTAPFQLPWAQAGARTTTGSHAPVVAPRSEPPAVSPPSLSPPSLSPPSLSKTQVAEQPVEDYPSEPLDLPWLADPVPLVDNTAAPAQPVAVPAQLHFLKRWTFVLVLIGVWIPSAAIGVGIYYMWFTSVDKTLPVFLLLIFLAVCTVVGLQLAMVENKPLVSAVALALLSAPMAATSAAAVLHGAYYFQWIERPL